MDMESWLPSERKRSLIFHYVGFTAGLALEKQGSCWQDLGSQSLTVYIKQVICMYIYITVHISCSQLSRLQSKILHLFIIQSLVRNSTWPDVKRSFSLNLLDKPDKASEFWFQKMKIFKAILIFLTILTRVLFFVKLSFSYYQRFNLTIILISNLCLWVSKQISGCSTVVNVLNVLDIIL